MSFFSTLFGAKRSPAGGNIKIELVTVQPGKFLMGSSEKEEGRLRDEIQHEVTLTHGFKIGKYPITQEEWEKVMGNNPSCFTNVHPRTPVNGVSWHDCQEFLYRLCRMTGKNWRLPTEAEWEYACRAGTLTALNSGKDLTDDYECPNMNEVAWYGRNSQKIPHPVGEKKPNAWGIYDMHGNIYEWCSDIYVPYSTAPVTDPVGNSTADDAAYVLRGGCWLVSARSCRSANRGYGHPEDSHEMYGLRVVCDEN